VADDELPANQGNVVVVDPDFLSTREGQSISAPDDLRVDVRDVQITNDDVADSAVEDQPFALDGCVRANPEQRFVGTDGEWRLTRRIEGDVEGRLAVARSQLAQDVLGRAARAVRDIAA